MHMAEYDIVLLPSFAQVEYWRKRDARLSKSGLFSQVVTTFNAWIADLWELHGDGRKIIDSLQRMTLMQVAFERAADGSPSQAEASQSILQTRRCSFDDDQALASLQEGSVTVTPGVVKLAASCVKSAAGVREFEGAIQAARQGTVVENLTLREMAFCKGISYYEDLVEEAHLVELGEAADYLARRAACVFPRRMRVLVACASPLDWRMAQFFGVCEMLEVDVELAPGDQGISCAPSGTQVKFAFPSGRYAEPALVADIVCAFEPKSEYVDAQARRFQSVIACADPLSLYKDIEQRLADEGLRGCVQAQVPFSSTDFGKRFLALVRVVDDAEGVVAGGAWPKEDLSDAIQPPFSGFNRIQAIQIDKALRGDRLARREECLGDLCLASDTFSHFEELAQDPQADILLGVFEQIAFSEPGRSAAWRAEQLGAAAALRSCTAAARVVGASMSSCVRVLEQVVVSVSYESVADGAGEDRRVIVTTQAAAAQLGANAASQVVLCDLTSDDFPVADKDDAAATLFGKLGLARYDTSLARARRTFAGLQELPSDQLICVRPLNDWDGVPTYPAAVLQEFIDSYREDATSDDDLDQTFAIPVSFMGTVVQRGEELLFSNALGMPRDAHQPTEAFDGARTLGHLGHTAARFVALPRRVPEGVPNPGFSPSPSQVETYLECPYKWFAQNRISVEELDEGFGPLERGTFSHAVLQEFYRRFQACGHAKVTPETLGEAKKLMFEVASSIRDAQEDIEAGQSRYVATTQIEHREIEACIEELVDFLDYEARFLPSFRPAYLEYAIKPEDGVQYAGHTFVGTVDRIDVDDSGRAVVIDYKGSILGAHRIAEATDAAPGKVQARMYAQVVKRLLGLDVVGALYVGYGKKRECAGAFDVRALEAADLPETRVDKCRCAAVSPSPSEEIQSHAAFPFQEMLDHTELIVEQAIAGMEAARVEPNPVSPDVCKYCPVAYCPKRGE